MADALGVKTKGLKELRRALKGVDADASKELDNQLKEVAEVVASGARQLFTAIDSRSAAGFKPRLRGFSQVMVTQTRRRKSGQRPDYGSLQMRRALIPALWSNKTNIERRLENMIESVGNSHGF